MTPDKLNRLWLLATAIIIFIILAGSLVIWLGRDPGRKIEFVKPDDEQNSASTVIIEGAVARPGAYPLKNDDTVSDLIVAAGGLDQINGTSQVKFVITQTENTTSPQKIDINRAEVWLLQALPNIGEVRAEAIVNYRTQNGPFKNIEEITHVPGLNQSTFEKIKGLITISE